MEHSYLRYRSLWATGVVTSPSCKIGVDHDKDEELVVCGAVRDVVWWSPSTGKLVRTFRGEVESSGFESSPNDGGRGEVVAVAVPVATDAALKHAVAVAYASGVVRVYRGRDEEDRFEVEGHRGAVHVLRWCPAACWLCSGGANGELVLWDCVGERGAWRLAGHKRAATDVCFLGSWTGGGTGLLVSASRDATIRVWDRDRCVETISCEAPAMGVDAAESRVASAGDDSSLRLWEFSSSEENLGSSSSMRRARPSEACQQLRFSPDGSKIGCLTATCLEVYAEQRREKKTKKRKRSLLVLVATVFPTDRPRSFGFLRDSVVVFGTRANTLEMRGVNDDDRDDDVRKIGVLGHRSAVRSLSLSSDARSVCAASAGGLKIWATASPTLERSLAAVKKVLSVCFVPGDSEVVAGAKDGSLRIVDVASGIDTEATPPHAGAVWALDAAILGNKICVMSGGADRELKIWRLAKSRTLKLTKTLDVEDEILAARFVCDVRFVAVATHDACVRVFFADTLKFKLTLYGHKLGALCVDGTTDASLLATASADKTIKLWGLEFGDLRRSILAHDDAVTALLFFRDTHYLVTASKDGALKMWDADRFLCVQHFKRGHVGEVWALAASPSGDRVYSGGADRSVRAWQRTDEPVFASEEAEARLDAELRDDRRETHAAIVAESSGGPSADRLADAIELARAEDAKTDDHHHHHHQQPSVLLLGRTTARYVLDALAAVPSPDLETAILLLPLDLLTSLLDYLAATLDATNLELVARAVTTAVKLHHKSVVAHEPLRAVLNTLRLSLRDSLGAERSIYGTNLAALRLAAFTT